MSGRRFAQRKFLRGDPVTDSGTLCQAWHDCMHINSRSFGPGHERHLKVYAMKNDPAMLLKAESRDYPDNRSALQ